jgi:hypothetical protein
MPVHVLYQDEGRRVVLGRKAEEHTLSLQFEKIAYNRLTFEGKCRLSDWKPVRFPSSALIRDPSVNLRRLNLLLGRRYTVGPRSGVFSNNYGVGTS